MRSIKEKKERALGTKLFIKAERCSSPKCATVRKPYKPGMHGPKQRRFTVSEYGRQLQEKQKIQITYGLNNRQMVTLFKKQSKEKILHTLEKRLDKVVFLLGLAKSPRIARQLVSHGHILVNKRKITVPSYTVKIGDSIGIRPESQKLKIFENIGEPLKKHDPPEWLKLDAGNLQGECTGEPQVDTSSLPFDINLVGEYYSR